MIDFACKDIKIEEIIKCSLNLSRAEYKIFNFLFENYNKYYTTYELSQKLDLELSTIQKAVKKMALRGVLTKTQKNLEKGGYVFEYKLKDKTEVKNIILSVVDSWVKKVDDKINNW
jgi:predicted transcriptional regulator